MMFTLTVLVIQAHPRHSSTEQEATQISTTVTYFKVERGIFSCHYNIQDDITFLDMTTRSSKSYEVIQDGKSRIFGGSSAITIPGNFIIHSSLAQECFS